MVEYFESPFKLSGGQKQMEREITRYLTFEHNCLQFRINLRKTDPIRNFALLRIKPLTSPFTFSEDCDCTVIVSSHDEHAKFTD